MKTFIIIFITIFSILISCTKDNVVIKDIDFNILFISRRINNSADWKIYSMNKDGTEQKEIVDLTVRYDYPMISNYGKKLLFVHNSEAWDYELYLVNTDGSGLNLIDSSYRYCNSPAWSIDDTKIVYTKYINDTTQGIFIYDIISKSINQLTSSRDCESPVFSPNGKTITYYQNSNICLMNIDGSDKRILLPNGGSFKWSPKGDKIVYTSEGDNRSSQIFLANSNGSGAKQLTNSYEPNWDSGFPSFGNYNPQWTPDESKIVYVSEAAHKFGNPEIFIMNSDGSNQIELTNSNHRSEDPVISPDGKFIVFASGMNLNYNSDIFIMDINGKNQNPLSKYVGDDCLPVIMKK